jgi:hypothetical protein
MLVAVVADNTAVVLTATTVLAVMAVVGLETELLTTVPTTSQAHVVLAEQQTVVVAVVDQQVAV